MDLVADNDVGQGTHAELEPARDAPSRPTRLVEALEERHMRLPHHPQLFGKVRLAALENSAYWSCSNEGRCAGSFLAKQRAR